MPTITHEQTNIWGPFNNILKSLSSYSCLKIPIRVHSTDTNEITHCNVSSGHLRASDKAARKRYRLMTNGIADYTAPTMPMSDSAPLRSTYWCMLIYSDETILPWIIQISAKVPNLTPLEKYQACEATIWWSSNVT